MKQCRSSLLLVPALVLLLAGRLTRAGDIEPELHPKSDEVFFKKDYPTDNRPEALHSFTHPFPIVQESDVYDKDYVKDENGDNGEWKAQAEYDRLKNKLIREQEDVKAALAREGDSEKHLKDALTAEGTAKSASEKAQADAADARSKSTQAKGASDEAATRKNGDAEALDAAEKEEAKEEMDLEGCLKKLAESKEKVKKMKTDAKTHSDELAKARLERLEMEKKEADDKVKAAEAILEYKMKKLEEDAKAGDAESARTLEELNRDKAGAADAKGKEGAAAAAESVGERTQQGLKGKSDEDKEKVEKERRTYAQEKAALEKMETDLKVAEGKLRGFRDVGHTGGIYRTKPTLAPRSSATVLAPSLLALVMIAFAQALL